MRFLIALLAVLGLAVAGATLAPTVAAADSGYVLALDQQPEQRPEQPPQQPGVQPGVVPDVEIEITERTVAGDWWANPVWIGMGIVALILLIVIVAIATRGGGGTTVVKD